VFFGVSRCIFSRVEGFALEKYTRQVHIFNLQIRTNAISILAQFSLRFIPSKNFFRYLIAIDMSDRFGKISIQPATPGTPVVEEIKKTIPQPPAKTVKGKKRPSPRRKNTTLIWLAAVIALFAIYNALGFWGVPYYLTNNLSDSFAKKTGMVFNPGHISFNPLTFRFATDDAKILTENGAPLATLKSLSADLAPFSLLRLDLVCNTVTLSELVFNITREQDGSYNFDKLFRQKPNGGTAEILNFSDLPFLFSLNNIAIKNGRVLFLDSPTGKTHIIDNIHLGLPTFSNIPFKTSQYLRPSFSAVINGSPVELSGQAHMGDSTDEATTLTCNLHALDLPLYAEYLPLNLPLLITGGKADGNINLLFNPVSQQEDKLSLDFQLQLTETELQTADETVFVTAPATELKGKMNPVAKTLVFTSISTKNPVFQSIGSSLLASIDTVFKKEKKGVAADSTPNTPFSVAIDELVVQDGTFHLWKEKGAKQPEVTWSTLQLSVKDYISAPSAENKKVPGSFLMQGAKGGTSSTFAWQGELTTTNSLDGSLKIDKMDFKELLLSIGADQGLTVHGLAELKGHLTVSFPQEPGSGLGYKLFDAELMVQDFQLSDNNLTVLSAPSLNITALGTAYKTINFGNIALENGSVFLPVNRIPDIFKQFTVGKYLIQDINFTGQITVFADEKGKQKTTYSDISLKAIDLDTPEKAKDNFSLSAKTSSGEAIQGQGDMRLSPFSLTIDTEFNGLAATDVFPMMSHSSLLNSLNGILSGKGSLSLPKKSYTGELQITKANIRKSSESFFSWNEMLLQGIKYTSEPFHLGIEATTINQPQFSWIINANDPGPMQLLASFFQSHLPTIQIENQSGEKTQIAIFPLDIGEIQFNQASVLVQDNRLKPKWKGDVTEFTGTIKDIHPTASPATSQLSFTGKLQDAPFTITGEMDIFAKEHNGKFHFALNGYSLSSFHEQLAALPEVNTKGGFFDLQLDCSVKEGQYQNSGSLLFSKIKPVSEKSDSALALALLTDQEDSFKLDYDFLRPTPLGKTIFLEEILTLFQTKVVKASVSPLLLASGDYADLIGNEFAEFEPGQSTLPEKGQEILVRYASLLNSHPQLGLELSGGIDREGDTPAIKAHLETLELKRVETENQKRYEAWQKEKIVFDQKIAEQQKKQAAKGKVVENTIPPAVLKDYIPLQPKPVIVDDAMLLELSRKRCQSVSQYLTEKLAIQPARIAVISQKRIPNTQSEIPANAVKIALAAIK
jgi:hypothetical protein